MIPATDEDRLKSKIYRELEGECPDYHELIKRCRVKYEEKNNFDNKPGTNSKHWFSKIIPTLDEQLLSYAFTHHSTPIKNQRDVDAKALKAIKKYTHSKGSDRASMHYFRIYNDIKRALGDFLTGNYYIDNVAEDETLEKSLNELILEEDPRSPATCRRPDRVGGGFASMQPPSNNNWIGSRAAKFSHTASAAAKSGATPRASRIPPPLLARASADIGRSDEPGRRRRRRNRSPRLAGPPRTAPLGAPTTTLQLFPERFSILHVLPPSHDFGERVRLLRDHGFPVPYRNCSMGQVKRQLPRCGRLATFAAPLRKPFPKKDLRFST